MISGLKMLSSCKGCSAFVDCLLFGISIYLIHANVSYLFLRRMPICGQDVKFSTNPMKLSAKIILWSRQLLPLRSVWRCGASVAAFLARKLGKLGSLITWRFATAKFPTGNIESWNFITTCIEGVNIHIYWWRKGCKACHSSTHSGKISGSHIGFGSQYPIIHVLLGQGTPGCYLTNYQIIIFRVGILSFTFDRLPFGTTSFFTPFR